MPSLETHLETIRCAFAHAPDPVLVIDERAAVLYVNELGRPRWTEGHTLNLDTPLGGALAPVLERRSLARFEWCESGPAGIRTWYICTASPLRADDGRFIWLCVSTDVTELKRSEERLRRSEQLMVDTQGVAHLGTWEWDVSEPHAYWSAELYRIYGLTPETYKPSYDAYLTMVHPEDRKRVIDATNRVFNEHVPYSHDERIFRPDGSMRYLHTWAYPILDDEGRLRRLVGVCQDITERELAEQQVRRMNAELERRVSERTRQLEASMRDLEAFNAMVSHDLRAPLNVISLTATTLNQVDADPREVARARERIMRAVSQMTGLIDDLLAFAGIGDAPLQRVEVDMSALAREIVAELKQTAPARAIEATIEPSITCFADRGLMRIVLQNLLGNAWKYTSRVAAARIAVTSTTVEGRRVLCVRDNGAGFDMKNAHRLFAPFQRLHSERDFAGTGVGLASVRRIVERHDARVWADGAPGSGATFFVELPARGSEDPASP
jgi:PAS domain S-box-containing protein